MNQPADAPLFAQRDRRILLGVCAAAVCWRWMLVVRMQVADLAALRDLRVGAEVATGDSGALADVWLGPWWAAMLALATTLGFDTYGAAQLLGCVFGGLALVPVACCAQRLRQGAGVAAALMLFTFPGPTLAAAGGSAIGLHMLWGGLALWALVARRYVVGAVLVVVALADTVSAGDDSSAFVLQRMLEAPLPLLMLGLLVIIASGLAYLPVRLRDFLLTVVVGGMLYMTWSNVDDRSPLIERELGFLAEDLLSPGQRLVTTLPRVAFYAGRRPMSPNALRSDVLVDEQVCVVVLSVGLMQELEESATKRFAQFQLSPQLADMALQHGVAVWFRRE